MCNVPDASENSRNHPKLGSFASDNGKPTTSKAIDPAEAPPCGNGLILMSVIDGALGEPRLNPVNRQVRPVLALARSAQSSSVVGGPALRI